MRTEVIKIGKTATLKTYLWDESKELGVKLRPAVLVLPGGGYEFCSDREAEPVALAYMAEGFDAFVLRYTVKQTFDAPFSEANAAMRIIKENADKWGIADGKIVVCGFSAGGHLACSLGVTGDIRPAAMILGYPAVIGSDWAHYKPYMPDMIGKVDKNTSPAFVFASRDDDTVPIRNSLTLCSTMAEHDVPFELHIFADGKHGYSLAKYHTSINEPRCDNPIAAKWFELSVKWLKKIVGDIEF